MAFFDIEEMIKVTASKIKEKLPAKITKLNTEKGDTLLSDIHGDAWFLYNLDEEAFNYQNFLVYGITSNPNLTDQNNVANIKTILMTFEIVVSRDDGDITENAFYKILRYTRALEEVVNENSGKIRGGTSFKVSSLVPTSFGISMTIDDQEVNRPFMSGGVSITAVLTS